MIAASVWIASLIEKSVSASIVRFLADTTPIDSEPCSPNGLPIAATGSPTWTSCVRANDERHQLESLRVDLHHADVRVRVVADDLALDLVAVLELHEDLSRLRLTLLPVPSVTTCAFVAM